MEVELEGVGAGDEKYYAAEVLQDGSRDRHCRWGLVLGSCVVSRGVGASRVFAEQLDRTAFLGQAGHWKGVAFIRYGLAPRQG